MYLNSYLSSLSWGSIWNCRILCLAIFVLKLNSYSVMTYWSITRTKKWTHTHGLSINSTAECSLVFRIKSSKTYCSCFTCLHPVNLRSIWCTLRSISVERFKLPVRNFFTHCKLNVRVLFVRITVDGLTMNQTIN